MKLRGFRSRVARTLFLLPGITIQRAMILVTTTLKTLRRVFEKLQAALQYKTIIIRARDRKATIPCPSYLVYRT